ncbi:dephospho-CoA kinase [Andreprevotia chitinilytica]|uniref:dephospho-CoA kinase n=1 Tax=Andreprevotia chitinilytica TaxID=396808 RepID=UPI000552F923|nr:dephospho-CoA kinase [Andreprevotia chitinilytica]
MQVIGLTGGIGSGKSTVAHLFAVRGIPVIDTDHIAHALSTPPSPLLSVIAETFGSDHLLPDGHLDRAKLREQVFHNPQAKQALEAILHPAIHHDVTQQLARLPATTPYALVVVPLFFETGAYYDVVTRVLVVDCDEQTQLARVLSRPGLSKETTQAIISLQATRQQRLSGADDVIQNTGTLDLLEEQVNALHQHYLGQS